MTRVAASASLTTTYTNSTEARALDELRAIGAEVRVSYDTTTTRLHAKSWIFHRPRGATTAYIGSSNLTHSAQVTGLEWNVRISGLRNPDVIAKMAAVFETYWESDDFVPYDRAEFLERTRRDELDQPWTMLPPTELHLRPFQERLLEQIEVARQHGHHRNLLVAATGTGKTVMAAVDYARLRRSVPRARLLFVAHRQEILEQSRATFRHALRGYGRQSWVRPDGRQGCTIVPTPTTSSLVSQGEGSARLHHLPRRTHVTRAPVTYRLAMSDGEVGAATPQFAPLYIELVRIANFRGLVGCELELEPCLTVLVGRNNAGKSRVLRALALALGSQPADLDDLTVGESSEATIDVIVAPPPPSSADQEEVFETNVAQRLRSIHVLREDPIQERFAWRTTIRRSGEGMGARTEMQILRFDSNTSDWVLADNAAVLSRTQRQMFSADYVGTHRDLVDELGRRGSAVRRVLSDLEIDDATRGELETELDGLNSRLIASSATLAAVQAALADMEVLVGLGAPSLSPLPSRLEEISQAIAFGLDTGHGALPVRLHGSGARSLTSLQVQGVLYERRLGADGPAIRPHPLTLIEEPEAHLHPQACLELSGLLASLRGQVVVSTHSSQVVSAVEPKSIRLIRHAGDTNQTLVYDLGPSRSDNLGVHRALRPETHTEEMEKLRRLVERPFGELVFASVLIIGDGATERAFLPIIIRHALGTRAHGVCVVDPENIASSLGHAAVKFAKLVDIPWLLFCDTDTAGEAAAHQLLAAHADGDDSHLVPITGTLGNEEVPGATERMLIAFDETMCREACFDTRPDLDAAWETIDLMKRVKGSIGTALAVVSSAGIQILPSGRHHLPRWLTG